MSENKLYRTLSINIHEIRKNKQNDTGNWTKPNMPKFLCRLLFLFIPTANKIPPPIARKNDKKHHRKKLSKNAPKLSTI
ncbi:MAG: hypothetical protein JKY54_05625 [Flavobacteriales bacterium]|nr:hypothetical protein [Flavobacteriales bacterium]